MSLSRGLRRGTFWCLLILTLAFLLFPLVWMALGSFKTQVDFMAYPPRWLFRPTLANYEKVLVGGDFLKFTWNSLVIAVYQQAFRGINVKIAEFENVRFRLVQINSHKFSQNLSRILLILRIVFCEYDTHQLR